MRSKTVLLSFSILITLLLAAALAYALQESVIKYIIAPATYAWRIVTIIYEALPQVVWWVIFLAILATVAARNLARHLRLAGPAPLPIQEQRLSRARLWARWLELSEKGDYSKWLLARNLARLALEIFAHQERQSLEQTREHLQSGKVRLPPDIQAYIQVGLEAPSFRHYTDILALLHSTHSVSPLDLNPERVIEFLEHRIQIGGSS
ncbi:MAG: hypothetical protein JXA78_12340 [Anaerolineales bacterium]|nr:hypothetical protein [Anaerolineales bacterium]